MIYINCIIVIVGLAGIQGFQQGQQPGGMTRELALEKLKVWQTLHSSSSSSIYT